MGRHKIIQDAHLLQSARAVFLESGAFGSTKEIARRAGISEGTLFKRYPTKAALFLAAMEPEQVDINAVIRSFAKETDPRRVLIEIGLRMLKYFRTAIPIVMHLMSHPTVSMKDVVVHVKSPPEKMLAEALAEHFAEATSRGTVKVDNPMATASLLVSAIHSLAVFELMEFYGGDKTDSIVAQFVEALWSGMAPKERNGNISSLRRKRKC